MIHKNDLALVRAQANYHVGDVVLYDNQLLGKPVLDRIVLIQNGDYYFRGDKTTSSIPGMPPAPNWSANCGCMWPASAGWWRGWAHPCTPGHWPEPPRRWSSWPVASVPVAVVGGPTRG